MHKLSLGESFEKSLFWRTCQITNKHEGQGRLGSGETVIHEATQAYYTTEGVLSNYSQAVAAELGTIANEVSTATRVILRPKHINTRPRSASQWMVVMCINQHDFMGIENQTASKPRDWEVRTSC